MENQDERTNRKMFATMAVAFVIIIAAFIAFYMGLIPGIGQGNKVANDLKAKVEAAKGPNLKTTLLNYIQANPQINADQKTMIKSFADSADLDFQFSDLKTSSGDGKGTVEIDSPKLGITVKDGDQPSQSGQISSPKLVISRDVANNNHFFYHTEGGIDFSANVGGTLSKIFTLSGEQPYNEIKYNADGYTGYFKSSAKNVKLIEGRGNTVVATIGESNIEGNSSLQNTKMDVYGKISEKNIVPGDMVKIMLGSIEPISINMDYAYKGDDYRPALEGIKSYGDKKNEEKSKLAADPSYKPADVTPDIKPFDGNLKLNDFSILMGSSGFIVNGSLDFKKSNPSAIPFGDINLKVAQYQKLIDYFSKFIKIPKEAIDKNIQMASEIGKNENGDISFKISFDGTSQVKINDKTTDQIKAITVKYAPEANVPAAAPPAPVTAKPLAATPVNPQIKK